MNIKELHSIVISGWNDIEPLSALKKKSSFITAVLQDGSLKRYTAQLNEDDEDEITFSPVIKFKNTSVQDRVTELNILKAYFADSEFSALLGQIGEVIFSTIQGQQWYLNYKLTIYASSIEQYLKDGNFNGLKHDLMKSLVSPVKLKYLVTYALRATDDLTDQESTQYLIYSSMNAARQPRIFEHIFNQVNPTLGLHWSTEDGFVSEALRVQLCLQKVEYIDSDADTGKEPEKIISYSHSLTNPVISAKNNPQF